MFYRVYECKPNRYTVDLSFISLKNERIFLFFLNFLVFFGKYFGLIGIFLSFEIKNFLNFSVSKTFP